MAATVARPMRQHRRAVRSSSEPDPLRLPRCYRGPIEENDIDEGCHANPVFGLGAILCEILTGHPPYVAPDATEVFRLASRGKLDDCFARLEASGADTELLAIVRVCLALELDERLRNAGLVSSRVTGYLEAAEKRLRQAELDRLEANTRVIEERKRRRVLMAAAAVIVLLPDRRHRGHRRGAGVVLARGSGRRRLAARWRLVEEFLRRTRESPLGEADHPLSTAPAHRVS